MTSTALLYHVENVRDMYGIIISVFFFFFCNFEVSFSGARKVDLEIGSGEEPILSDPRSHNGSM